MKRVYLLVEGPSDAAFLRRILPDEALQDAELVPAGGIHGIESLARSLLVRRHRPVAVVMDADSLAPDVAEERRLETEEFIRSADASARLKVVSAVPEIEAWFFVSPDAIEHIFGQRVSADRIKLGLRDPKGTLKELAETSNRKWDIDQALAALDDDDIRRIRDIPAVAELSAFLCDVRASDQAA